jgi:hypothetical protein
LQVEDWQDYREGEDNNGDQAEREPYEIERIATVLAVTCMFLAALYSIFAILLFLYFGSKDNVEDELITSTKQLSSISNDPRREKFITMGEAGEKYDL